LILYRAIEESGPTLTLAVFNRGEKIAILIQSDEKKAEVFELTKL